MSIITVRQLEEADKEWLKGEAKRAGISMEEFVRRLIRQVRNQATKKPSEIVAECFGEEFGVHLGERDIGGFRDVNFGVDE